MTLLKYIGIFITVYLYLCTMCLMYWVVGNLCTVYTTAYSLLEKTNLGCAYLGCTHLQGTLGKWAAWHNGYHYRFWRQSLLVQIPHLLFTSHVILGKLLKLSLPISLSVNGAIIVHYLFKTSSSYQNW